MVDRTTKSVETIFLEIVDLPPADRSAALIDRCGRDEQLRARVERLLQADESNRSDTVLSSPAVDLARDQAPNRIGTYVVSGTAGEGGMGAVYDALHESTRRRAAVKLIRAGVAGSHGRQRLAIEAETLGRLNDPGIAQLYDAGLVEVTWPDGTRSHRPFIAMEFVEDALSITQYARKHRSSSDDCVRLMAQVARAVQHAHQRGVIHRDLKPGNVLVNQSTGIPKIVDFGIARLTDSDATAVTATGQVIGTIRYMSPEQAAGDAKLIDTRTDIYSLGAILYELLAGRPMVETDGGSAVGAVVQLINSTPKQLRILRPELSGDLDAIVHKAVEKNPDDRYASAAAFADDLEQFLAGGEISARSPTTIERFVRVVKRNKAKVAAVAVVLLSLFGGTIAATWGMIRAERARRAEAEQRIIAQRKTIEAEQEAAKARAAHADATAYGQFLTTRILATARPKDMQGGLGLDATIAEALRTAETELEHDFADRPGAEALTRHAIGITWRQRGDFAAAEKHFRKAIELATKAFGENDPNTLNMRNSLQVLLEQAQRRSDDLSEPQRILSDLEATAGSKDVRTITARYNLAIYLAKSGKYADALQLLETVYAHRQEVIGAEHAVTLLTLSDIAELHQLLGNSDKAQSIQRGLIEDLARMLGDKNPQTLNARYRLGCLFMLSGQNEQAVDELAQVIPELRLALGDQNVTTLDAICQLAKCSLRLKRYDQAIPLYREYARGRGSLIGERGPQTARMLGQITVALLDAEQYTAAEEFARKSMELQTALAPDALPMFEAQCLLGESLAGMARIDEAEPLLKSALTGLDRQSGLSTQLQTRQHRSREALARIFEAKGRTIEAAALRTKPPATQSTTRPSTQP